MIGCGLPILDMNVKMKVCRELAHSVQTAKEGDRQHEGQSVGEENVR